MPRMSRGPVRLAAVLLAALSTACAANTAGSSEPAAGSDDAVAGANVFVVQNNHMEGRDVIVYLTPEGRGERQRLGTVGAGETATFTQPVERGYYTLTAAHNLGENTSSRFNIAGPGTVTWVLSTNRVTFRSR